MTGRPCPYCGKLPCICGKVIVLEREPGEILHTEGHPFCSDASCPCREDKGNVNLLNDLIAQGLLTEFEATLVMRGATI